jgi:hypothetical protein
MGDATFAVHNGYPAGGLQRWPGAGLHHGQHRHGASNDAGDDRDISPQWSKSVLGDNPAKFSRHDAGAGAAGF